MRAVILALALAATNAFVLPSAPRAGVRSVELDAKKSVRTPPPAPPRRSSLTPPARRATPPQKHTHPFLTPTPPS